MRPGETLLGQAPAFTAAAPISELEVSRNDLLSLKVSIPEAALAAPVAAPQPVTIASAPALTQQAAPEPDQNDVMRQMSFSILKELTTTPATPQTEAPQTDIKVAAIEAKPAPQPITDTAALQMQIAMALGTDASATPKPAAPAQPDQTTYIIQAGDSLPGISYRFYGTTAAYLTILNANADQIADASTLVPGTTLIIPEL